MIFVLDTHGRVGRESKSRSTQTVSWVLHSMWTAVTKEYVECHKSTNVTIEGKVCLQKDEEI